MCLNSSVHLNDKTILFPMITWKKAPLLDLFELAYGFSEAASLMCKSVIAHGFAMLQGGRES